MEFESLKAVIDYAIEKEKEAADFYKSVSREEPMSGAKQMLEEFAQEERKHQTMLEKFQTEGIDRNLAEYRLKWIPDIKRSDYVVEMEYKKGMGFTDLLMLAMKREEKALKLYDEMLAKAEGEDAKKLFKVLCQEESKHKNTLEIMYDDHMAKVGD
ncbi:MAG: rubrerythrin [Desulfobacteraceae bacterium 4572_88]|nr:MAG: rubrerythrin [Desulfobacteraceae bacterium 4572_88]